MATALKELTIALGLLASNPSAIGPQLGLSGYVWHVADLAQCSGKRVSDCKLLTSKWDWKRPQFFTISLRSSERKGKLELGLYLDNQDLTDTDMVCIMLIARTKSGAISGGEFVNLEVTNQHSRFEYVSIPVAVNLVPDKLEIGSKQCDETYRQDRKSAQRVLSRS
ncbi:hypothetical protein D4A92_22800 (plasmid) [Rhizobium rosettiformans]|uniref:Uncharacterized protein n=1 Tax=Rhizobium rosettiformans TaxID=1368430 RepID=A0ABX7F2B9_9HYPH|nr:hypothetical protein [Rhizobium rosettiformans]QRF54350.1 hypothetical protein D4A92_22800 [Rhizobium rosettiformans]